jgi:hypothetical protein
MLDLHQRHLQHFHNFSGGLYEKTQQSHTFTHCQPIFPNAFVSAERGLRGFSRKRRLNNFILKFCNFSSGVYFTARFCWYERCLKALTPF